jgi:hypothetical protein
MIRQDLAIIIKLMERADSSAISLSNPNHRLRKNAQCFDQIIIGLGTCIHTILNFT